MAFAAYFVISALAISIKIIFSLFFTNGTYNSFIIFAAASLSVPITILSGRWQSVIAVPSFKNSGFEITSKVSPLFLKSNCVCIDCLTFCAVPTGTVDLSIRYIWRHICLPMLSATSNTSWRSALPSSPIGVPTAIKQIFASASASLISAVNFSLPAW